MRKQIKAHEERDVKNTAEKDPSTPMPSYLLDRSNPTAAKALSSAIKNKRNEKSARFSVPLPKVKGISEEEMFRVVTTGKKTQKKGWKRMVTKPTFVGYVDMGPFLLSRVPEQILLIPCLYQSRLYAETRQVRALHPSRKFPVSQSNDLPANMFDRWVYDVR